MAIIEALASGLPILTTDTCQVAELINGRAAFVVSVDTKAIADFTRPGMVVYDVGAHIGYWSLYFARILDGTGHVFSFEPLPANFQRLQPNIALSGLEHMIYPFPMAISDKDAEVQLIVHNYSSMGKLAGFHGRYNSYIADINVFGKKLDSFVYVDGYSPPDLLKMDIEGSEATAILGMERILREARPICLLELHGHEARGITLAMLWRHGYSLLHMAPGYPKITSDSRLSWKDHVIALPPS